MLVEKSCAYVFTPVVSGVSNCRPCLGVYLTIHLSFHQLGVLSLTIYDQQDQGNVSKVRLAQSDTLPAEASQHDNTGMVMTYDLGSPCPGDPIGTWCIHCRNKTEVREQSSYVFKNYLPHLFIAHLPFSCVVSYVGLGSYVSHSTVHVTLSSS
jgi:hypothetical protein